MRRTTFLGLLLALGLILGCASQTAEQPSMPMHQDEAAMPHEQAPMDQSDMTDTMHDTAMDESAQMDDSMPTMDDSPMPADESSDMADKSAPMHETSSGPDVTFVLSGTNYKFMMDGEDNPELHVKKGDRVHVELTSIEGMHDFVLDEFNASTDRVRENRGTVSVDFVADKAGSFEYYCSVGSHRAAGMWGHFVVE